MNCSCCGAKINPKGHLICDDCNTPCKCGCGFVNAGVIRLIKENIEDNKKHIKTLLSLYKNDYYS